jgi:ribokinase
MNRIVVVGSINMDIIMETNKLPKKGETVLGNNIINKPGGKGSNQAFTASKFGAETYLFGKIGKDNYGYELLHYFKSQNINTKFITQEDNEKTGVAAVIIDSRAENSIIVIPGANHSFKETDFNKLAKILDEVDIALFQFEIPKEVAFKAIEMAHKKNVKILLDPAPVLEIPDEIYSKIDVIMPNLQEAKELTNLSNGDKLSDYADYFINKGVKCVLLTLGNKGIYAKNNEEEYTLPICKVDSVDSTGAGDCFAGAFAAKYKNNDLLKALQFANVAAALSTTKVGAQTSIPSEEKISKILDREELK